jgi:hypothetical protein
LGNGFLLYYSEIKHILGSRELIIQDPLPTFPTLEYLGKTGYEIWIKDPTHHDHSAIMPLYLKPHAIFSK